MKMERLEELGVYIVQNPGGLHVYSASVAPALCGSSGGRAHILDA